MSIAGKKKWVIPGGHIPFKSTGREPELLSQDKIAVLNTGDKDVEITMTVLYSDSEEEGPYRLTIKAKRVRKIRINDIIDPFPVELERDYALIIEAGEPVVIQYTRMNTGYEKAALMGTIAFHSVI